MVAIKEAKCGRVIELVIFSSVGQRVAWPKTILKLCACYRCIPCTHTSDFVGLRRQLCKRQHRLNFFTVHLFPQKNQIMIMQMKKTVHNYFNSLFEKKYVAQMHQV